MTTLYTVPDFNNICGKINTSIKVIQDLVDQL